MNIRYLVKHNDNPVFKAIKSVHCCITNFKVPAPRIIWAPIWQLINFTRNVYYWMLGTFFITPIHRALCERVGKNFCAGAFLPFVLGRGRIFLSDDVCIYGKVNFRFGSIKNEIPEIHIGNRTRIGHNVVFDISGKLTIGDDCLIASHVTFLDCAGHSLDGEERRKGTLPSERDIRPIKIGNNVWVGNGAFVLPGTNIEDNCVIAARTVVGRKIPANHLVYPAQSKLIKIRKIY